MNAQGFVSGKASFYDKEGMSVSVEANVLTAVSLEVEHDVLLQDTHAWGGLMLPLFDDGNNMIRIFLSTSLFNTDPRLKYGIGIVHKGVVVSILRRSGSLGFTMGFTL